MRLTPPCTGVCSTHKEKVLPVHLHPVEESHRLSYILPLTVNWVGFEPVFKGLEHRSEL